jgi:hypothetical protein
MRLPMARPSPFALLLVASVLASFVTASCRRGCGDAPAVELYVDGFEPEQVRFEVEDLGALDDAAFEARRKSPDIDGALRVEPGACAGPCRVAAVSVFLKNDGADAQPPPVVRLKSPPSRPARSPIVFQGDEISRGRIGRIRWLVQLYPEETALTAVLSSSVRLVEPPSSATPTPAPVPPSAPILHPQQEAP